MEYKIIKMPGMKLIGFEKEFSVENSYAEIPKFWNEIFEKYAGNPEKPANACEKALVENRIGEYGICVDDIGGNRFRYLIAGEYAGGEVPAGMTLYEFPAGEWAVFDCFGPMPETLQALNTKIFRDWLPGNPEFELSVNATVEWYDYANSETSAPDYHSAIRLPIRRK